MPRDSCHDPRSARLAATHVQLLVVLSLAMSAAPAVGLDQGQPREQVQVTATRVPVPRQEVAADVSIITGEELRARGASDLASALCLVAGVEAPPGGDTGPAGAVPSFWGLHEFDAFLLVVDGVPWGGAFNPAIPTLNLNDVERIEVMKGAAPVVFGATSFVGVIHVIHYAAGASAQETHVGYGSFGSVRASLSTAVGSAGPFRQSLAFDARKTGYSDARESVRGGNLLYRAAIPLADGELAVDLGLGLMRQAPPSPTVREGGALTVRTPLDANFNPPDSRIDEVRPQLRVAFDRQTSLGRWGTTLAVSRSSVRDVRGFLRSSLINDGSQNADYQDQDRSVKDVYADTHVGSRLSETLGSVFGADVLYGMGRQQSRNGAYFVPIDGATAAPRVDALSRDEVNDLADRRAYFGQYAQLEWAPLPRLSSSAGLRLNETREQKESSHVDTHDPNADAAGQRSRRQTRMTAMAGLVLQAWRGESGSLGLFADYRDSVKPAAIDFGPDYTPDVLKSESARSVEAGERLELGGGAVSIDCSVFLQDFRNLVLQTLDANGLPVFQNAGGERLKGAEVSARVAQGRNLQLQLGFSYHNASFTQGVATEGGANVSLAGRQLTLAPHWLGALGILWMPVDGLSGSVNANWVGRRYLDLANSAQAGAYATIDTIARYRRGDFSVSLAARNLTNRRVPVTQSEFGDASYYLLPARSLVADFSWKIRN